MNSKREATVCIVYHQPIADWVGLKPARAFDWLYSFLHLAEKKNGVVYEGRRWGAFTYGQLVELSDALPNRDAWKNALSTLVKEELILEDHAPGIGKYYCVNFHKIKTKLGDNFAGYEQDMQRQADSLENWLSEKAPAPRAGSGQNTQTKSPRPKRAGHPE